MIPQNIYNPLEMYVNEFKDKFKEVCHSTFEALATEARVDVEANRQTCREINNTEELLVKVKRMIGWWRALCVFVWIVFVIGVIYTIIFFKNDNVGLGISLIVVCIIALGILFSKIHPKLNSLVSKRDNIQDTIKNLIELAWEQMMPLNRLYDWDIFARMMTKTIPRLEFDPFFTVQRLEELKTIYNWDESFNNKKRSVLFSHSGLINGNPFVICRTKKMEWGQKEYEGKLKIEWTEYERDSSGRTRAVRRTETLHATIKRPIPVYYQKTRLIYGNTAAPDLTFTRKKSGYASKQGSVRFNLKKKSLRRKARNLSDNDYAMLTNEDFEVAFDTSNRNNNHQYALLFTPLAQNTMMSILADKNIGYGDDFDFEKDRMINYIIADHMQSSEMDMNPDQYRDYSFDKAAEEFYKKNASHFRAIYFAFAPLLAIPMYQQIRSHEDFYGKEIKRQSTFWEHEAIANFWGADKFEHPDCVTESILKTEMVGSPDQEATIKVTAYGYRTEPRVTYVSVRGGDGYMHDVPVHWEEYLPVIGNGSFVMREDDPQLPDDVTQTQRLEHIESLLGQVGHSVYRRHISSGLQLSK